MPYKKRCLAMMAGVLLSSSASVWAEMSAPYGWYLEGNIGSTHISDAGYPGSVSSSSIGANANLGYKFMPYFALESGYTQYANTTIKDDASNTKAGKARNYSFYLAGKGIWPIATSSAELFAKIGVNRVNSKVTIQDQAAADNIGLSSGSHSATGLYLGLGGQYYFTPALAANMQWAVANGSNTTGNPSLFSVGMSYIFG